MTHLESIAAMKAILENYQANEKLLQRETILEVLSMSSTTNSSEAIEKLKASSIEKLVKLREAVALEIASLVNKVAEIVSKDNLATANIQDCLNDLYQGYGSSADAIKVFHDIFNASPNFLGENQDKVITATKFANSLKIRRQRGRPRAFPFLAKRAEREINKLKFGNKVQNPSQNDETIFHETARRLSKIGLRLTENQIWKWYSKNFQS